MNKKLLSILLLFIAYTVAFGQNRNATFLAYIDKYKEIAIEQMRNHHIPASITLAQGLLESGAGQSDLAQRSNNHFGIKVGSDWNGPFVKHNDDRINERFRVYKSVRESFEDHSKFLKKERYQRLFRLSTLDYKGWARGLKACGYATSPTYADRLISIIEQYKLNDLDEDPDNPWANYKPQVTVKTPSRPSFHVIRMVNDLACVTAYEGDTWDSLAKELGINKRKLLSFNEISEEIAVVPGMNVFLMKKRTKGAHHMKGKWHKVSKGESMYSISQYYGVRLSNLYKSNMKSPDYQPTEGDLLRVR